MHLEIARSLLLMVALLLAGVCVAGARLSWVDRSSPSWRSRVRIPFPAPNQRAARPAVDPIDCCFSATILQFKSAILAFSASVQACPPV